MKKKFLLLILATLLSTGCSIEVVNEQHSDNNSQQNSNILDDENNKPIPVEDEKDDDEKPVIPPVIDDEKDDDPPVVNGKILLDDYVTYTFHDGNTPQYNDDWDFYYGTSYKPNGDLWQNPTSSFPYSGIEFHDKNQYLVSPLFKSYEKLEVRFEFWFSSHDSTKYKAEKDKSQFIIEEYNDSNIKCGADEIVISRSDIPTNSKSKEFRTYIFNNSMTSFHLKFNNFIPNGDSGYTAVLCSITLHGWPN